MQPQSRDLISWTHEALKHCFDLPFLERHCRATILSGRFEDGHSLQEALSRVVKQLRPPVQIAARAPAWRIYNVLNLRYVQGLSQSETAVQLGIGPRQMRREQQRAVQAVAALLFPEQDVRIMDAQTMLPADALLQPDAPEPAHEFTHLHDLMRSTLLLFNPVLEQQQIHVTVTAPSSMPAVHASQMVLRQLLVSSISWMLRNVTGTTVAIEGTIERGKIIVALSKPLPPADAPSEPSQEELATVNQLADLIGAKVTQTDLPDGTRLQLALPTNDAQCVLMIDDNLHAIQLVQRYLQQSNDFYLVPVSKPQDALRQVIATYPACILLDVMMPEHDGWELLTLFRAHPDTSKIPIIVSSILKEDELARTLGATAVLTKPFNAAQLISLLKAVTVA
jgi:CheY-like chemotaxis protein